MVITTTQLANLRYDGVMSLDEFLKETGQGITMKVIGIPEHFGEAILYGGHSIQDDAQLRHYFVIERLDGHDYSKGNDHTKNIFEAEKGRLEERHGKRVTVL
ncbi:MAG: hypothetical protein AABX51_09035 [Nanoarchaeota archaeon]